MRCEICGGATSYYFSKTFNAFNLGEVDYWRCDTCGFVFSRTHLEMSQEAWTELNLLCHETYQGGDENVLDPRWKARIAAQALALSELAAAGLLDPGGRWVDFGCGDGVLSNVCSREHGLKLLKYDEHMAAGNDYLAAEDMVEGAFDFVVSTSVFEHMTRREQWDGVEALVSPGGAFGLHTLVAETVPKDPGWFYLQAPHCAFFTNDAMKRLFKDWGYRSSIYNVAASLWIWFRSDPKEVESRIAELNRTASSPFLFQEGFLDYWKSDPRLPKPAPTPAGSAADFASPPPHGKNAPTPHGSMRDGSD